MPLLRNIRFYILAFSVTLSLIYTLFTFTQYSGSTSFIRLEQLFAFTATIYLYLALLAGPFCYTFRFFPFRAKYLKARRALGVSAFYFGFLHFCITFFYQLGGIPGLSFLSGKYLFAISLSFTALLILASMTATSFDAVIEKMTFPRWKRLHRLVYIAGFFIVIHALLLGTHFADLNTWIPQLYLYALLFLLILESQRIDAFLKKRFAFSPQIGLVTALLIGVFVVTTVTAFLPEGTAIPLGIHAQHIQLAKDAQNGNTQLNSTIPGLVGDRTKRFTVSFDHPDTVAPQTDTPLSFSVFDAATGNPVTLYQKVYDKTLHLIIVDSTLKSFSHIHPELKGNTFTITTQFSTNSTYHLYLDFQPFGAIEQQFAFTLPVGSGVGEKPNFKPDTILTKTFGDYRVTMTKPQTLSATEMTIGQQTISFTIKDKYNNPVKTLKPYLGAYGHLVMINTLTYDYLHIHPSVLTTPKPDQNGGPEVSFLPLGLYGPIKPGMYRVFAQFNPDNHLFTADFTVEVK